MSRALPHTGDLLDIKSGVHWQGSPTKTVTQSLSGFHSCPCFAHTAGRTPLNKTQSLFLLKSLQELYPTQGKTLKSPEAIKTLHNLTFAPALSIISHSYPWLHPHGLCASLACLHPRTFALAAHSDISPAPSLFPPGLCSHSTEVEAHQPFYLPVSLQNVPSLKAQISACHRHLFLCPQHQQVLKLFPGLSRECPLTCLLVTSPPLCPEATVAPWGCCREGR